MHIDVIALSVGGLERTAILFAEHRGKSYRPRYAHGRFNFMTGDKSIYRLSSVVRRYGRRKI